MNRCREIPARRNKGENRDEMLFSAFFDEIVDPTKIHLKVPKCEILMS